MNDQVEMVVRYFLTLVGAFAINKGWINPGDYSTLTVDLLATAGPVVALFTFCWGLYAHSHGAKIASVNKAIVAGTATATPGGLVTSKV